MERAARRPHAVTRAVHPYKKIRQVRKKKTEEKRQKKGGRSNEKENEEEEEELGRGKKKKAQREGSKDDEQREPGYGSWGPNRKRGKSTGKYVVDSAERRPKAKWNSVRWFSGRSSETAGRHHCLRARFFSPHRVVPPSSLSTVSFLEPYSLRRSSPDHRLRTRRRRRSRRIRREEIAKMQSATVRTRVRADSAAETVRLGLKGRLHLHSIYREDFFRPFFFFTFSFSFFPSILVFCSLRRFFCFSSRYIRTLVKYQMHHFYRGFIAPANDKLSGIKVATARFSSSNSRWPRICASVRFNRPDRSGFLLPIAVPPATFDRIAVMIRRY